MCSHVSSVFVFLIFISVNLFFFFFFNDTATTEIYTLSLHDALPICMVLAAEGRKANDSHADCYQYFCVPEYGTANGRQKYRSEERFSRNAETDLVCRLLLEKKKKK